MNRTSNSRRQMVSALTICIILGDTWQPLWKCEGYSSSLEDMGRFPPLNMYLMCDALPKKLSH